MSIFGVTYSRPRFDMAEDSSGDRQSNDRASYLEELIVRQELACSFVNFCADYDSYWNAATREFEVYGKIRYMSQRGLKRKADPDAHVEKVDRLTEKVKGVSAPQNGQP